MKGALLLLPLMSSAADYSTSRSTVDGLEIIRLVDAPRRAEVSIVPSVGNIAYEFQVNGKNAFWTSFRTAAELKAKPALCGNPLLWPWANRLDQDAYWVNGRKYLINPDLGNIRRDGNQKPIHGLLSFSSRWQVVKLEADAQSARVTSRLEFWKYPDLMAQFPFAHTVEMTYRLKDGVLEVETTLQNQSTEPMPVSLGYHPYFRLHDAPRDDWKVHLSAREQVVLSSLLIPTGERKPNSHADPQLLANTQLDDVFTGLVRSDDGRAHFSVQGKKEKIEVIYGPKYTVAVVYAPARRDFICFEPMAAVTNAINLAHAGLYNEFAERRAGRRVAGKFLDRSQRVLNNASQVLAHPLPDITAQNRLNLAARVSERFYRQNY